MIFQIDRIVRDVRVALDENKTSRQFLDEEDIDTLSVEDIIRAKILEAVRRVVTEAPAHLLDGGVPFGDAVFWSDGTSPFKGSFAGWIILPEDFMRLFVFKMSDWERPVYEVVTAGDPRYQMQFSRYAGIRGNPQKPVVAIVSRQEGRVLELFSCRSKEATVEQALYLPLPRIDRNDGVQIPERCYMAVIYRAASLALATLQRLDAANLMDELSKGLLI